MIARRKGLQRGVKDALEQVTEIRLKGVTHWRIGMLDPIGVREGDL
jgi:hypothetical protein